MDSEIQHEPMEQDEIGLNEGEHAETFMFQDNICEEQGEEEKFGRFMGQEYDFPPGENPDDLQRIYDSEFETKKRKIFLDI